MLVRCAARFRAVERAFQQTSNVCGAMKDLLLVPLLIACQVFQQCRPVGTYLLPTLT